EKKHREGIGRKRGRGERPASAVWLAHRTRRLTPAVRPRTNGFSPSFPSVFLLCDLCASVVSFLVASPGPGAPVSGFLRAPCRRVAAAGRGPSRSRGRTRPPPA